MSRRLAIPLAVLFLASCAKEPDKEALLRHIREKFNVISEVKLELGPKAKSEIPGFNVYEVTFHRGGQTKKERLYVSKNGQHYFLGMPGDLRQDPALARLAKVDFGVTHAKGPPSAPVTVIEYTDFECPKCAEMHAYVHGPFWNEYGGRVRLIHKSFPLPGHPWAMVAAQAAECAALQSQEGFWNYANLIFSGQSQIKAENAAVVLVDLAKFAGLNEGALKACLQSGATEGAVRKDIYEGQSLGFNGTPTYLINGRFITGTNPAVLKTAVDEAFQSALPK